MRQPSLVLIAALFCLMWATGACDRSPAPDRSVRSYQVRGIVRGVAPDRSTVSIEHEDIPGFMPSMTMPFTVKDQKEIADLKIGDGISFRLTATLKDLFLDQVKKIPASEVRVAEPTPAASVSSPAPARLREGDAAPSFNLINQNHEPVTLDTFRGRPFVLTFIFTRCPVPTFCPRISQNFFELQETIKSDQALAGRVRLLSITLDPQFDTPEILKSYAHQQKADEQVWGFAAGAPAEIDKLTQSFAVHVEPEGGTISHGLATALIGPDGKVAKIWRGNGWTPSEVIDELRRSSKL